MTEHSMEQEKISIRQRWGVKHAMQNIVALGMIPWARTVAQKRSNLGSYTSGSTGWLVAFLREAPQFDFYSLCLKTIVDSC